MKGYKIFILFILLSVITFAGNNAISVWVESVGFDSLTNTMKVTLKSRTGEKFEEMDRLKLDGLQIINGLNDVSYTDVYADRESEIIENPKVITEWYAEVELGFVLVNEPVTINGTIIVEDFVDGNQHVIDGRSITFGPFAIAPNDKTELKIYEKLSDEGNWMNNSTNIVGKEIEIDGRIFTKGGSGSFEDDPGVYALISTDGGAKIEKLKVKRNNGTEEILTVPYPEGSEAVVMKIGGFESNKINTVTIRPVSIYGIVGDEVDLDFLIDTQINTMYLEDGIIGEIGSDRNIQIDLSKLIELAGVTEYSYVFRVGNKPETDDESNLDGQSFTTLTENSITSTPKWVDGKVKISTSGFIAGSKGTLLFTVYDKLGHKKTFEKIYFIPDQSEIKATTEGEAKQRRSRVKLVSEGAIDKFEVESSVDTSSE